MTSNKTDQSVRRLQEQHREFTRARNGGWKQPVPAKRDTAIAEFVAQGFPTLRDEEWKYTNIAPAVDVAYALPWSETPDVDADTVARTLAAYAGGPLLVFVNGVFSETHSSLADLPAGVLVEDLQTALDRQRPGLDTLDSMRGSGDGPFATLNTAFLGHGVYVHVAEDTDAGRPVHCLFLSVTGGTPRQSHPRLFVQAQRGSALTLIEQYAGGDGEVYLTNALVEMQVGENATVDHYRLQLESRDAHHVATNLARLGSGARYNNHYFSFGGALSRNNIRSVLDGEGAHCVLNGLYMAQGTQHMDSHTLIDHARPHCSSEEQYKGVLSDEGRGVFTGRIVVRQDAQKTDARQSNKNLLLSERAMVDTRPQLEIYADDVRCTHGATIGRLDETALFYLRSRGIPADRARDILSYAFASDTLRKVSASALNDWLDKHIHSLLEESWQQG